MTSLFSPDLDTTAGSSKSISYNAVVRGKFENFRKMLIELAAVPYLERIEEISIQPQSDSMEFRLKIWIAVSN
jgi:hypothetical protein